MARTTATAGQWTLVPDTGGSMLLEARFAGVYVDTSGTSPADPTEGYSLADGQSWIISAGITVRVWPISNKNTDVFSHLS